MTTAIDPSELRDLLVSSVQTLGEKAEDVRGLIPDAWQDGATTVMDRLSDSVQDARSRVSHPAKDRRMRAAGVVLVLSFVVLLWRRRKQRHVSDSEL